MSIEIPQDLLKQLDEIRDSGIVDMLDIAAIQKIAYEKQQYHLIIWLHFNKENYRAGISKGFKGIKTELNSCEISTCRNFQSCINTGYFLCLENRKITKELTLDIAKKYITFEKDGTAIMDSISIRAELKRLGLTSINLGLEKILNL